MMVRKIGRGALHPAAWAGLALLACGSARAADPVATQPDKLLVCIDSASPTASRDQGVADLVARHSGLTLTTVGFVGTEDDEDSDGPPPKQLESMLAGKCDLLMGFPVDASNTVLPRGFLATYPYAQTGFSLVVAPDQAAHSLADLPAGTEVAVTYQTTPTKYFAAHPNVTADELKSDADTLAAVVKGTVKAAIVWQPTVDAYLAKNPDGPKLGVFPLEEPHARYNVVALFLPRAIHQASALNDTMVALLTTALRPATTASAAPEAPPALYTDAQASTGHIKYLGNCAMCHGPKLTGRAGPALKGPNFANAKSAFSVSDIFNIVAQNMPASNPGSLDQGDYVQIMAYLLQQNGYPAGSKALDFNGASTSKVPLIYRGG